MTKILKPIKFKPIRFDPINRDILRAMTSTKLRVTPSQISKAIGIHPATAKTRIMGLQREKLINCTPKGNRLYCRPNIPLISKKLKKGFF